ncbi:MAG: hypothetical protein C0490_09140 [Marivirga sp.]|nr:hypothetical protein [Marivirga sp.]
MRQRNFIIISILTLGMVFPFIDFLVGLEIFYLLIPLTVSLFASLALLIGFLIWDRAKLKQSILGIFAIPLFIVGQFLSTWTVHKIQRFRSELVIREIEGIVSLTNQIPNDYHTTYGIEFSKLQTDNQFVIKYSRGFMTTEVYSSEQKTWRSQGWND